MNVRTIPLADWQAEMAKRGKLDCKFVCPVCGHEASPNDFKALGADYQRAPRECIGRVLGHEGGSAFGEPAHPEGGPCDYAAFGLFDLCEVRVQTPGDDKPMSVFSFAEPSPKSPETGAK